MLRAGLGLLETCSSVLGLSENVCCEGRRCDEASKLFDAGRADWEVEDEGTGYVHWTSLLAQFRHCGFSSSHCVRYISRTSHFDIT